MIKCLLSAKIGFKMCFVLKKTLKGIRGMRPDNQKVLRALGPRTNYFKRFFYRSINYS